MYYLGGSARVPCNNLNLFSRIFNTTISEFRDGPHPRPGVKARVSRIIPTQNHTLNSPPLASALHMGHVLHCSSVAHSSQRHMCPQGMRMCVRSPTRHTTQIERLASEAAAVAARAGRAAAAPVAPRPPRPPRPTIPRPALPWLEASPAAWGAGA